ncbi:MAG: HypC/HybG/HupF family hydrogenase formation chaperone [Candidatus Omnitrophota bacterium]
MCLGIPMKVIKIKGQLGWVQAGGLVRQVNIQMVPKVKIGDYVIVHAGFAIEILDPKAAQETLSLLREISNEVH